MREKDIKDNIEKCLDEVPGPWTIGVTDWPRGRKQRLSSDATWVMWKANGQKVACRIRDYFIERGCEKDPDEVKDPNCLANFIYIFRQ